MTDSNYLLQTIIQIYGGNMATFREYCDKLSTSQLEALLREEYLGKGSLPIEVILDICDTLSKRDPTKPSVDDLLRQMCKQYL